VAAGCITDVARLLLGHEQRIGRGWRTGTTVVLAPDGAVGGVDVRGGGPGTHETDLLRPENLVQRVHGVCLTGGSAFGLAAASGVMAVLEARRIGFPVGADGEHVVPIVPAAVIYDLGRGGHVGNRPDAGFGERAAARARARPGPTGTVGAGAGAVAGGLQGGVGTASTTLPNGVRVAALAVVNSAGHVIDPVTALPWEPGARPVRRPPASERRALASHVRAARPPLNTTIGLVATSGALTKAECTKFAGVAHDGLARAIRPAHSMFDGDTVFALATGVDDTVGPEVEPRLAGRARAGVLNAVFEAGALCFADACTAAVWDARSVRGGPPAYRDLCPSAFGSGSAS